LKKLVNITSQGIALFHPIKPMLASRHAPEEVIKQLEGSAFVIEQKFDGERIQVHKNGKEVRIFSR
jgi:DNA ligase-4